MFGLFVVAIIGVIFIKEMLTNAYHDGQDRQKARDKGFRYYTDSQGTRRRVDNNHKVFEHVPYTDDGSWDMVDEDAVTGQILRNYSQEKRDKEAEKEKERIEKNRKSKEEAIAKGEMIYSSYELSPSTKTMNYFPRRVSDDLLLEEDAYYRYYYQHVLRDGRCRFVLWRSEDEYKEKSNIGYSVEKDIHFNNLTYNNDDFYDYYNGGLWKPTRKELDEYVQKIKPIGYESFYIINK